MGKCNCDENSKHGQKRCQKPKRCHKHKHKRCHKDNLKIIRDDYGIPTIVGEGSVYEIFKKVGLAFSQDRTFQLVSELATTSGRQAEFFGPARRDDNIDDDIERRRNQRSDEEILRQFYSDQVSDNVRDVIKGLYCGFKKGIKSLCDKPFSELPCEFGDYNLRPEATISLFTLVGTIKRVALRNIETIWGIDTQREQLRQIYNIMDVKSVTNPNGLSFEDARDVMTDLSGNPDGTTTSVTDITCFNVSGNMVNKNREVASVSKDSVKTSVMETSRKEGLKIELEKEVTEDDGSNTQSMGVVIGPQHTDDGSTIVINNPQGNTNGEAIKWQYRIKTPNHSWNSFVIASYFASGRGSFNNNGYSFSNSLQSQYGGPSVDLLWVKESELVVAREEVIKVRDPAFYLDIEQDQTTVIDFVYEHPDYKGTIIRSENVPGFGDNPVWRLFRNPIYHNQEYITTLGLIDVWFAKSFTELESLIKTPKGYANDGVYLGGDCEGNIFAYESARPMILKNGVPAIDRYLPQSTVGILGTSFPPADSDYGSPPFIGHINPETGLLVHWNGFFTQNQLQRRKYPQYQRMIKICNFIKDILAERKFDWNDAQQLNVFGMANDYLHDGYIFNYAFQERFYQALDNVGLNYLSQAEIDRTHELLDDYKGELIYPNTYSGIINSEDLDARFTFAVGWFGTVVINLIGRPDPNNLPYLWTDLFSTEFDLWTLNKAGTIGDRGTKTCAPSLRNQTAASVFYNTFSTTDIGSFRNSVEPFGSLFQLIFDCPAVDVGNVLISPVWEQVLTNSGLTKDEFIVSALRESIDNYFSDIYTEIGPDNAEPLVEGWGKGCRNKQTPRQVDVQTRQQTKAPLYVDPVSPPTFIGFILLKNQSDTWTRSKLYTKEYTEKYGKHIQLEMVNVVGESQVLSCVDGERIPNVHFGDQFPRWNQIDLIEQPDISLLTKKQCK